MPSMQTSRMISNAFTNNAKTIGQIHKEHADFAMEQTWMDDIQSKVCYIYDHKHDDQPDKNKYMTYDNTIKYKIDAKFIVSSYGSMDKDQVAYHLMLRPSQKLVFNELDDLYYYETDYRKKYNMDNFPVGLYVDIPDEKGIYVKWLICDFEEGNQFTKYQILPCDYRFQWVSIKNAKRYTYQMWGCTRSMNSYTSGVWQDRYIISLDDVNRCLLPLNDITQSFGHINENGENQRIIVSAKTDNPLAFKVSKIENTKPIGIIKATLKENSFNPHTDFIEKDENDNIIGMWADYYDSSIIPEKSEQEEITQIYCELSSSIYSIKPNGSARTLQNKYYDANNEDVTDLFSDKSKKYTFEIDGNDVSEYVVYNEQPDMNLVKIKFNNDDYLGKVLIVRSDIEGIIGEVKLEIV